MSAKTLVPLNNDNANDFLPPLIPQILSSAKLARPFPLSAPVTIMVGGHSLQANQFAGLSNSSNVNAIVSMVLNAGTVTVTTAVPHNIPVTSPVQSTATVIITNTVPSAYNGTYTATSTGYSTFTFPLGGSPGAVTTPGNYTFSVVTSNDASPLVHALGLSGTEASINWQAQGGITAQYWIDTFMPAAVASGAQVWYGDFCTNDINGMGSATVTDTVNALWARLQVIYAAAQSAGALFIDPTVPPIGNDGTNNYSTQNKTTVINRVNALKAAYWKARPYWGILHDKYDLSVDLTKYATGTTDGSGFEPYKATQSYDQLHPSNNQCMLEAQQSLAPICTKILPARRLAASNSDYVGNNASSNQIFPNPMLNGSVAGKAGTLTGNMPTNLNALVQNGNITGTVAITSGDSYGGNKVVFTLAVTGSPTLASDVWFYLYSDALANAVNNHICDFAFRIKVTSDVPCIHRHTSRLSNASGSEQLQIGNPTYPNKPPELYPASFEYLALPSQSKRFVDASGLYFNTQLYFAANSAQTIITVQQITVRDLGA